MDKERKVHIFAKDFKSSPLNILYERSRCSREFITRPKWFDVEPSKRLSLRSSSTRLEVTLDSHWSIIDDVKLLKERSRKERELEKLNLEGLNERIK